LVCLHDKSFEVMVEAAQAVGEVGTDGQAVEALMTLKEDLRWQVRDAALKGIKRLMERRVIAPSPEILSQVAAFVLTATDFSPHFSIKATYRTIQDCCRERTMEEGPLEQPTILPETLARKR